ncbi:hypothetical protein COCSUDRAFT_64928 [Coccomyxa subellipsoidea C-169]|uniref:Uncharacterized protein n=1 Tax=Coccomyxa subellipsoidea (strain C-169) TaxID=574566 RepID=I0Z5R4_COCSC|nr:hypothetical protein COCSUDRAFT_64928 [Coccomyxa subellipsoidea C-169]EIE25983.1 hypothetical protein COCSUDRAFT_64928 [Coccomyxa subellipsoidea C-169]|eukprot:XP_005650527.1 hypothetical protein COCSUDRAFT_64928 [Coccomyxa subellipsoidea C-169]
MLSSSPNWREIDKNVDRLIDEFEVPRATSAPPHLQEGRWGGGPQVGAVSGPSNGDGRWTPAEGFSDIRCDEDYEAFYRAQLEAGRKLPPPLEHGTVYEKLPPHLQHRLSQQQQRLLASRMSPSPNGLDPINERGVSPAPGNGLNMLQAFQQLGMNEHRHSPAPPPMSQQEQLENLAGLQQHLAQQGDQQAQLMAIMAAAGGLRPNSTPPPMTHTPPLPSQTPPVPSGTPGAVSLAANAAALAAAAAGQNGFQGGMNGGLLGSLEYQAAYQACFYLRAFY